MDLLQNIGAAALGSRFRRLAEALSSDASQVYAAYGVDLEPSWFPVFFYLSQNDSGTITEIAESIGHSRPFVSRVVAQMRKGGLVATSQTSDDGRVTMVQMTEKGRALLPGLRIQMEDVAIAADGLLSSAGSGFLATLTNLEKSLDEKSLLERVLAVRRSREVSDVEIVDYTPDLRADFERLNRDWIEQHWEVEDADRAVFDDPEGTILCGGGRILIARRRDGSVIGTCALLPHGTNELELAKMAVAASERGKGIGRLLGEAAVATARESGVERLYLESNTVLAPAISLYRKLGFTEVERCSSPYARCNIQMELRL